MREIDSINGKIKIPKEFEITKTKRRLHIKTPWMSRIDRLSKDNFQITTQQYFRQKGRDKPYVEEGTMFIDGIIFNVREVDKKSSEVNHG